MTRSGNKYEKPLGLDIDFEDALTSFGNTDPIEVSDKQTAEMPKASHQGILKVGDLDIDCYVLEDGRSLFNKIGMTKAMGFKSAGGNAFIKTVSGKGIGSELDQNLSNTIQKPIVFKPMGLYLAHGYEAETLVEICKAIIRAADAGKLTSQQDPLKRQAQTLISAFAKVGVVALIHEATGYQEIRDPVALRYLTNQYIAEEKRQWMLEFPEGFYEQLHRIYGSKALTQNKYGTVVRNRPQHFAKLIHEYVYQPLENGMVLEELDKINPKEGDKGTRKDRFHQHLSEDHGIEKLQNQVREIITLMKVSDNAQAFKKLFKKRFPQSGDQGELLD